LGGDTGGVSAGAGRPPSTTHADLEGVVLRVGGVGNGWLVGVRWGRGASCWVLRQQPPGGVGFQGIACGGPGLGLPGVVWPGAPASSGIGCGRCWGVGVGWLLVEMCIVDASIFVVKLSRADGGCLGTRGR
jgi:hypothetical protein